MRPSVSFLLRFFAATAILFGAWTFGGVADVYAQFVVNISSPLMGLVNGFHVSSVLPTDLGLNVMITRGRGDVPLPLRPREIFSGLVPFLALVVASQGLAWQRRLTSVVAGLGILFLFHVGLMLLSPYLTGIPQSDLSIVWKQRVNMTIDIFYAFYGLVGFAALPFLLWWSLTDGVGGLMSAPPAQAGNSDSV